MLRPVRSNICGCSLFYLKFHCLSVFSVNIISHSVESLQSKESLSDVVIGRGCNDFRKIESRYLV